jgi:hypothetical protein
LTDPDGVCTGADAGAIIALVSEAGPFLKAHRLLYHSTQGSRASFRTCIESDEEEEKCTGARTRPGRVSTGKEGD